MKYIATNAPANQAENIAELTKEVAGLDFSEVLSNILSHGGFKVVNVAGGEITLTNGEMTAVLNFANDTATETASEDLLARMNLPEGITVMTVDDLLRSLGA